MNPLKWLRQASAKSERATTRDGFLSHAAESHALAHGLYDGLRDWRARPGDLPDNDDVQAEPAYYKGGYFVGTLTHALIVLGLALNYLV